MTRSKKRLLEGEEAGVVQPAQPAFQQPQQEPQPQLVLEQPLPPPPLPVHPLHAVNMTEQLLAAYAADEDFASTVDQYDQDKHGLYRTKGKNQIVVPNCQQLKARILVEMHDAQFAGHVGITKTLERISRIFWWPRMRSESDWPFFLSLAEFAVNNSWQESIQSTPFLVNTGQSPLTPALLELPGEVYCPSARKLSEWWQSNVKQARHFMEQAQQRQAYLANKGRREVEFSPGQLVLLSTKNLRLKPGKAKKLLPRFIGPFKVLEHVGPVAVRLDLPPAMARMHPVFHVALLRPYTSEHPHLPPPVDWLDEAPLYEVEKLLAHRGVRAGRARGYLVKWQGYDDSYNTSHKEHMESFVVLQLWRRESSNIVMQGFIDRVQGFIDRVQGFIDRAQGFIDRAQGFGVAQFLGVSDRVQGFADLAQGFKDLVQGFIDRAQGIKA
ncbi:hypothetical protein QJQ45_002928 [Haematococcus lacustris]|nr:hypothetical protein QJQ45_002928 [Haematococcus lacustris]